MNSRKKGLVFGLLVLLAALAVGLWLALRVPPREPWRIAILAQGVAAEQIAALATVALAEHSADIVLERQEIAAALAERQWATLGLAERHELGRLLGVDVFVNLTEPESGVLSLRIFDGGTGVILLDRGLPPEGIDAQVRFLVDGVTECRERPAVQYDLGVLAVRNAGVPAVDFYRYSGAATAVMRYLGESPQLRILERDALGIVTRERQLTGVERALFPAAFGLEFDFIPENDAVSAVVRLLQADGAVRARWSYAAADAGWPLAAARAILFELGAADQVREPGDPKREAVRYAAEARSLNGVDFEAARRAWENAVALDSGCLEYRYELARRLNVEARMRFQRRSAAGAEEGMRLAWESMGLVEDIEAAAPDFMPGLWVSCGHPGRELGYEWRYWNEPRPPDAEEYLVRLRHHLARESARYLGGPNDPTAAFQSTAEVEGSLRMLFRGYHGEYYYDLAAMTTDCLADWMAWAKRTAEWLAEHPDDVKVLEPMLDWSIFPQWDYDESRLVSALAAYEEETARLAASPLSNFRAIAAQITLLRRLAAGVDPEPEIAACLATLQELLPPPGSDATAIYHAEFVVWDLQQMMNRTAWGKPLRSLLLKQVTEWQAARGEFNIYTVTGYLESSEADPAEYLRRLERVPGFLRLRHIGCFGPEHVQDLVRALRRSVAAYGAVWPEEDAAATVAGDTWQATLLLDLSPPGGWNPDLAFLRAAVDEATGKLYVMFEVQDGHGLHVGVGVLDGRDWRELYRRPEKCIEPEAFAVADGKLLLGERDGILVVPLDGKGEARWITDLPGRQVRYLTQLDDRIYCVMTGVYRTGSRETPPETVLMSCRSDGSQRRIHWSSLDREQRNVFDRDIPYQIIALVADAPRDRLLVITGKPLGGVWEYRPSDDSARLLLDLRDFYEGWGGMQRGKLYFEVGESCYFELDPATDVSRFLYCSQGENSCSRQVAEESSGLTPDRIGDNWPPRTLEFVVTADGALLALAAQNEFFVLPAEKEIPMRSFSGFDAALQLIHHPDGNSAWVLSRSQVWRIAPESSEEAVK